VSSIDGSKGSDAHLVLSERTSQLLSSMQTEYTSATITGPISRLVEDLAAKLFAITVQKSLDIKGKKASVISATKRS
jgi:hypothetical protein